MAGINFLYEEYRKNPGRVESLLNGKLEISEKLDGSRFQVQRDASGNLHYFKRKDVAITKIDRTLSRYYEKGVNHFENLSEEKTIQMPDGWRFGMEYFPNLQPVTVIYDRLPLNNLVLTDIQVRDPKGRVLEVITDKGTLSRWSNILEVETPPILFEGELTKDQKSKILSFLNTPYQDLVARFKTESFTSFILRMLNPEITNSFMNSDITKDIDGLVFRFDGKEAMRVSNPEVILKKAETRSPEKPSDIYSLTLMILHEYMTALDFSKVKLRERSFEDRYIEFISKVYNMFIKSPVYKEHFEGGVDFDLPKFLTREESNVNFKFVQDPETLENLKKNNTNRELYKILLASMKSHKKKPIGFFTKELVSHHNDLVDKIADYVKSNANLRENLAFFTFEEFRNNFLSESDVWVEDFGKEAPEAEEELPIFPTYHEVSKPKRDPISALKVLDKMLAGGGAEDDKKKTNVCLMKGKFQPFHNGHLSSISDAFKESGMKVFIAIMRKRANDSFPEELHSAIMDEMKGNKNIAGYIFTDGFTIGEIEKDLPKKFRVAAFAGSPDECQDARAEKGENFPSYPMTKHVKTSQIIDKIRQEDVESFKKLVPKQLHNYFYKIKNEVPSS